LPFKLALSLRTLYCRFLTLVNQLRICFRERPVSSAMIFLSSLLRYGYSILSKKCFCRIFFARFVILAPWPASEDESSPSAFVYFDFWAYWNMSSLAYFVGIEISVFSLHSFGIKASWVLSGCLVSPWLMSRISGSDGSKILCLFPSVEISQLSYKVSNGWLVFIWWSLRSSIIWATLKTWSGYGLSWLPMLTFWTGFKSPFGILFS